MSGSTVSYRRTVTILVCGALLACTSIAYAHGHDGDGDRNGHRRGDDRHHHGGQHHRGPGCGDRPSREARDPLLPIVARMNSFFHSHEVDGVTLDARYPDSKGRCPVKGDNGYFVSSTPHANGKFRDKYKQSSYTDAATVAFGALSGELEKTGKVAVGDCGLAIRHNAALSTSFYFADRGATAGTATTAVGECSYARFRAVGGDAKVPGKTPKNN